jgi:hypothetical protein
MLTGRTVILTKEGLKKVESLKLTDKLYDCNNKLVSIDSIEKFQILVSPVCIDNIECTQDQKMFFNKKWHDAIEFVNKQRQLLPRKTRTMYRIHTGTNVWVGDFLLHLN